MSAMDSTRQPDLTRQRILEAGFQEIHRHGYQAASVASILADTGLTKGPCTTTSRARRNSAWRWSTRWSGAA
ncbi:TetR/AcrR family transcriptional regulator [Parasulfuritortus cantonensis]|uniref:TetR/AcrR family transcriptional regulator n=1 Tax=Parasulfuritortus cantonensis TaxID=2528202 RepID=UPI001F0DF542|nr:TetR/AcrR family transcriptional regulator [Parasulfuritortus cantonensis]